jgi:ankyrin repeat protein
MRTSAGRAVRGAAATALLWILGGTACPGQDRVDPSRDQRGRPTEPTFESDTPQDAELLRAAFRGDRQAVLDLLAAGSNIDAKQTYPHFYPGATPLCLTVNQANVEFVRLLLDRGARAANCELPVDTFRNPEIIGLLLSHGANPNTTNEGHYTPLLRAATSWWADPVNYTTIIKQLLLAGADPNATTNRGENALHLLEYSPNSIAVFSRANPDSFKPRPDAAAYNDVVFALVRAGTLVNGRQAYLFDKVCCGELMYRQGEPYCYPVLNNVCQVDALREVCPPERLEKVDLGTTPLMAAAAWPADAPLVKALLLAGADPRLKNSNGKTAVGLAASREIRSLLEGKIEPQAPLAQVPPTRPAIPLSQPKESPSITKARPTVASVPKPPAVEYPSNVEFVCYKGPNVRPKDNEQADSSFGSQRLLEVRFKDPDNLLGHDALSEIAAEIARALQIWRRMCTDCATANAAVLRMDDKVYMDEFLSGVLKGIDYERIQQHPVISLAPCPNSAPAVFACPNCPTAPKTAMAQPAQFPTPSSGWPIDVASSIVSSRLNLRVPLYPYVEVLPSDPAVDRLCAAPLAKVPSLLRGARAAFDCAADKTGPQQIRSVLVIKMVDGYTLCGPDDNIVGCESNEFTIELNAHRYKYVQHLSGATEFGKGALPVDLQIVLMHEIGHWTGIQMHLTSPDNIMSAYLSRCHCIDRAVVEALAQATRQPGSQGPPQKLFYEPRPPAPVAAASKH